MSAQESATRARTPDVPFVPTPQPVVEAMLKLADVKKGDVLYDLGSGDGRLVVTAAKLYGVKGTGIDIDPQRIQEANANAKKEGVENLVRFLNQDLFEADIHDATVVTLYLLPGINLKLKPKLWKDLKPGTRIVSHSFDMGDWQPEKKEDIDGRIIYFWTIPKNGANASTLVRARDLDNHGYHDRPLRRARGRYLDLCIMAARWKRCARLDGYFVGLPVFLVALGRYDQPRMLWLCDKAAHVLLRPGGDDLGVR